MTQIDTKGMEVAPLEDDMLKSLMEAEKTINGHRPKHEIYLLAVTRKL